MVMYFVADKKMHVLMLPVFFCGHEINSVIEKTPTSD